MESALASRFGDRHILLTTKDGRLVCVTPAGRDEVLAFSPSAPTPLLRWTGCHRPPPQPGPGGVVQSYEEALNALELAERLDVSDPVLRAADLLVYPVLTRDRQAMADLVSNTLGPPQRARGGSQPLIDTLTAYFDAGCVSAEAARRLALSVRAFNHRLDRIHRPDQQV